MREDFKKVLCEEPRSKGWGNRKALNKVKGCKKKYQKGTSGKFDEWDLPSKESMFGKRGRGNKSFGEHLGPLVRFLRSSVGRRWDEVYSEIRKACPNDSTVSAHVYEHLWGYVKRYTHLEDGKLVIREDWGEMHEFFVSRRDNNFYVDPDGILRRVPRKKYKVPKKKNLNVHKHDGKIYVRKNKIWYKTTLRPLPKPQPYIEESTGYGGRIRKQTKYRFTNFRDVYLDVSNFSGGYDGQDGARACKQAYGKSVYCCRLRQLNTRELKKLGIKE